MDDSPATIDRTAILVLGMHRSGTSALTGMLGALGCALPVDGIAAHPDNPKGYWEPLALVRESDRLFRTARTSWFDPRRLDLADIPDAALRDHRQAFARALAASFGDAPRIAVKDPRLARLVPLFVAAAADRGFATRAILMLRGPAAIARSLQARDRSTADYAQALWLRHMIDAERDSRALPRAIVDYDDLVADWHSAIAPVVALVRGAGFAIDAGTAAAIDDRLDGSLRHHRDADAAPAVDPRLAALVAEAVPAFAALRARDDAAAWARIDAIAERFDGDPRLCDDIVHDELRHRRVRELGRAQIEDQEAAADPAPSPAPEPIPDAQPEAEMPEAEMPPTEPPEAEAILPDTPNAAGDQAPDAPVFPEHGRDLAAEAALVRASGLLDAAWYLDRYPEVAAAGRDPVDHYLTVGAALGYDPSPLFQTAYYARQMARRTLLRAGRG